MDGSPESLRENLEILRRQFERMFRTRQELFAEMATFIKKAAQFKENVVRLRAFGEHWPSGPATLLQDAPVGCLDSRKKKAAEGSFWEELPQLSPPH